MSESQRPPLKSAQQFLIAGLLVGLLAGCLVGSAIAWFYIDTTRIVYSGGAHPDELTDNYQGHYLAMVVDSYVVNPQPEQARERLKAFRPVPIIRGLARQSANYAFNGKSAEAQTTNQLALYLKTEGQWSDQIIQTVIADLINQYRAAGDAVREQAVSDFSAVLLGAVPSPGAPPVAPDQPTTPGAVETPQTQAPPIAAPAGLPWRLITAICLGIFLIVVVVFTILWIIRRQTASQMSAKKQVVYKGEGPPPIMQWDSTYTEGRNPYDESITLETKEGDFLGEAGIGMNDVVPDSGGSQVMDFDLWVFDKTDINTYSRILMTEKAYNDDALRAKVEANPLAEAVLAKSGETIAIESQTMRIEVKLEDVAFDDTNTYFTNLKINMDVFLQEGVDIKIGEMQVPDHLG